MRACCTSSSTRVSIRFAAAEAALHFAAEFSGPITVVHAVGIPVACVLCAQAVLEQ
jgi:hypothetical protein